MSRARMNYELLAGSFMYEQYEYVYEYKILSFS